MILGCKMATYKKCFQSEDETECMLEESEQLNAC